MLQITNKAIKWVFRFIVLLACFFSITSVFMFSSKLNHYNYQLLYDQTQQLSRIVVRQAAQMAFDAMQSKDNERIKQLISNLENEEFIFDATIYGRAGDMLHSSKNTLALSELTGINTPLSIASIGRHQLVEPIAQDGQYLGFLRITLEHGKIIQVASNSLHKNINFIHTMLIIALFTGAIFLLILTKRVEFWLAPFLSRRY